MSTKAQREIAHRLRVFEHARDNGNVAFTCRYSAYPVILFIGGKEII